MVIHDLGYRALRYEATPGWRRLLPLAWIEVGVLFRHRLGQAFLLLCLLPTLGYLMLQLWLSGIVELGGIETRRLQQELEVIDPSRIGFYLEPVLDYSRISILVLAALVGCRSIAKDRAAGALELLWTRGITPRQYFAGKWLGSIALLGMICVAAPFLLWLYSVLSAPDWGLLERTIRFLPRVLLALATYTLLLSFWAVAFSAIAGSANVATLFWLLLLGGLAVLRTVLAQMFRGQTWWRGVDPYEAAVRVARWIAGETRVGWNWPVGYALAGLATVTILLGVLAARRLRMGEALP
jgi:ABC-type transport system involved in multi-copper enzyme maturation permease subunit